MNLLRSEWIKLTTTRTTWVMLGIGLALEALFAGLVTGLVNFSDLGDPEEQLTGLGVLMTLMLVLGVLVITTEFRHGTTGSTFLAAPRRWPVLVAKLIACVAIGLLAGVAFAVVNGALVLPIYSGRGGELPPTSTVVQVYAGVVASFGILCAFGLGVGAIVRNQVGAIIAVLAVVFIVSPLPELLPGSIGDYFPAQAIGSLHGREEGDSSLGQISGGLVLSAWALSLWAIGTALICRRDLSE